MAAEKILIVDDDEDVLLIVQTILDNAGYSAVTARNGREGVEKAIGLRPDLILLDVMMPELSGWEVCTTLKSAPETRRIPIAMLTVKAEIRDLITGMQVGADDYLTKPFEFAELLARVRALLRRGAAAAPPTLSAGDLTLDPATRKVTRAGRPIELSPREYALLEFFLRNRGRVLSRTLIAQHVWGVDFDTFTNVIDVYVNYLRRKIDAAGEPKLLQTVRGVGYVLKEPER